jgi:hypothetical protein
VFRRTNDWLVEKVEINLFPLILDSAVVANNGPPMNNNFMISIAGKKHKKFWHH